MYSRLPILLATLVLLSLEVSDIFFPEDSAENTANNWLALLRDSAMYFTKEIIYQTFQNTSDFIIVDCF